jgi:ubiquinone/menaquinone biosynthesis C-methylase UbiE
MPKPSFPTVEIYSDLRGGPPRSGIRARLIWAAAHVFTALLRLAFHLLYYPLAFTYDAVAWVVSAGEWAEWRRCVIPHLPPGRVLEMAHGTGTLALEMADRGFAVAAVDLSPAMGKIASGKKRARGAASASMPSPDPALVRADVRQLPFPNGFFSSAVSTFPAEFIFQPRTLREVRRILEPGGLWIILPTAYPEWIASRLLPVDRRDPSLDPLAGFARHLEAEGFSVSTEIVRRPHSRVMLILAEKK